MLSTPQSVWLPNFAHGPTDDSEGLGCLRTFENRITFIHRRRHHREYIARPDATTEIKRFPGSRTARGMPSCTW